MKIFPAIDLRGGRAVRLVEGEAASETSYDADPVARAVAFERDGAEALHVVDLDGAFAGGGEANRDIVAAILSRLSVPVQVGGGLRTETAADVALAAGARWVILGTAAVEQFDMVEQLATRHPGRIVVGIDARDGRVATRGWVDVTEIDAVELGRRVAAAGIERVVYTDIARDGRLVGPNVEATARLARETGLLVTASGGVGSLDDLRRLRDAGTHSCIVGKALYEGRFSLVEAIRAGRGD
jgi:phosphoribosylformimino-5-aminoimidazole carboxamide ribotide isomerase